MFETPTTLVVGAGASLDFGLPSGPQLWDAVRRKITEAFHRALEQQQSYYSAVDSLRIAAQTSLSTEVLIRSLNPDGAKAFGQLREISDAVSNADVHSSVDDFLLDNPSMTTAVKGIVAAHLAGSLYTENNRRWTRKRGLVDKLTNSGDPTTLNWIRVFVGVCRSFLRNKKVRSRLIIINFNYDRLLETVMRVLWERSEAAFPDFDECFSFVYPHGAFSDLPEEIREPANWILRQASSIGFAGKPGNEVEAIARKAIDDSYTTLMIGFSCSAANAVLLGLARRHAKKIYYQNFDHKDARLTRVMRNLGTPDLHADPNGCAALVNNGFFEQVGRLTPEPSIRSVTKSTARPAKD